MNIMIYFKGAKDKRFSVINPITGDYHTRLVYAPMWPEKMIPAFKAWIEQNKQCAPDCKIQIRLAGTNRIIYQ